jgi:hypothetical protein
MHSHETPDTVMSRLVRIETKLSVFIIDTQKHLNTMEGKIDQLQQTIDEIYPPEEAQCQNASSV